MKTNGELTDGERLKRKFAELKIAKGIGKAEFARITTFPGGASMISQNVSNHKPISLAGAKAYSLGFGCAIEDISPSIAASLPNEGTGKKSRGLLDQQVSDTSPIEAISANEFPSYPLAQAQMDKAIALSGQAASLGPKAAMAGLSELVAALHPVLVNAGRDALRQWVDGAIDAEQAAATLEALTHTSENIKVNNGNLSPKKVA